MAATIYKLAISQAARTKDGETDRGRAACAVSHLLAALEEYLESDGLSGDVGDAAIPGTATSREFE